MAPNRTTGKINYGQFGNLVGLRPSPSNLNYTSITTTRLRKCTNNNNKKTRTIKISEKLYERFCEHSRHYYNHETYETIIKDLLDCFDKHNEDIRWYHNNNNNNDKYNNDNT